MWHRSIYLVVCFSLRILGILRKVIFVKRTSFETCYVDSSKYDSILRFFLGQLCKIIRLYSCGDFTFKYVFRFKSQLVRKENQVFTPKLTTILFEMYDICHCYELTHLSVQTECICYQGGDGRTQRPLFFCHILLLWSLYIVLGF